MIEKPSRFLSVIFWGSVFVESWLLLLRRIPSDATSWGFLLFFLVVAFLASAVASSREK